jgi:hypothetical protein
MSCCHARSDPVYFFNLLCLAGPFVLTYVSLHTLITVVYFWEITLWNYSFIEWNRRMTYTMLLLILFLVIT